MEKGAGVIRTLFSSGSYYINFGCPFGQVGRVYFLRKFIGLRRKRSQLGLDIFRGLSAAC
jgi:hypothetical protein